MSPILFSMFVFTFAGAISPGPVNLIAASIGASAGFSRALPHVTGASLSYSAIIWLLGSGLNRVLTTYPDITHLLQYLGAVYLLYLSAKIATTQPSTPLKIQTRRLTGVMEGVFSQILNPKAWLVAMSGVSLFVTTGPNASDQLLVFCGISAAVCFFSIATWAALGKLISKWLHHAAHQTLFNRIMASLLMMTVVNMLFGI